MKDDACLFPLNLCAFHANVDCSEALPFVNGILKISLPHSYIYFFSFPPYTIINLSHIFFSSLQLGITLWKGMLKKQPYSARFFYIMYIDVIHNLMHNTYMAVSHYTHNG